jgi:hypothetical protein
MTAEQVPFFADRALSQGKQGVETDRTDSLHEKVGEIWEKAPILEEVTLDSSQLAPSEKRAEIGSSKS